MSSWRKAGKTNQKTHRERHQPEARQHLGVLEKKNDYKLRAKDFHEKEETLKLLYKRALTKDPDEFYHHMIRSKIEDDEHHELEDSDEHTKQQQELMETQDIKYIMMKRTMEAKKIEKLHSELHLIDSANSFKNKHKFFVDDEEEASKFDIVAHLDTHPSLLNRKTNRLRLKDIEKINLPDINEEVLKKANEKKVSSYRELKNRIEREKELAIVQRKIELKKTIRQKTASKPKRIKRGTAKSAPVYKFKYERKK